MKRMTRGDDDNEKDDYSNSDGRRQRWPTNDYDDDDNYDAEEVRDYVSSDRENDKQEDE